MQSKVRCLQEELRQRDVPSPLTKLVIFDCYDGPVAGVAWSAKCSLDLRYDLLESDALANLRIFCQSFQPDHSTYSYMLVRRRIVACRLNRGRHGSQSGTLHRTRSRQIRSGRSMRSLQAPWRRHLSWPPCTSMNASSRQLRYLGSLPRKPGRRLRGRGAMGKSLSLIGSRSWDSTARPISTLTMTPRTRMTMLSHLSRLGDTRRLKSGTLSETELRAEASDGSSAPLIRRDWQYSKRCDQ